MRKQLVRAVLATCLGFGATVQAQQSDDLKARVESVLRTPGYEHGLWGLLVVDRKTGEVVYQRDADALFKPASVTKLYTTSAALVDLGMDHRFQTPVHRRGEVDKDGVLNGDLILVASGDPSLGGRTGPDGTMLFVDQDHSYATGNFHSTLVPADPLAGLDSLAREIQTLKIKAITGDVLIDDRLFEAAPSTGSGPSKVTPIMLNDNVIDVVATPGEKPGEAASVRIVPETQFVTFDAQVQTGPAGSRPVLSVESLGLRRFVVRGSLPVGHAPAVRIYEIEEPADFARAAFIEVLRRRGIRVAASPLGRNRIEDLPSTAEVAKLPKVAEYTSPPFREYVKVILKVSQNLHASVLPMLLAAHQGKTTIEAGLKREGALLATLGIDVRAISFGGGAGGSNADLVTPRATVALLRAMAERPEFAAFEPALPVLGKDGTLSKAVGPDSPARGHVRAKTGTYWVENGLDGKAVLTSKALAGFMETTSGRTLVFAFFLNHVPLDSDAATVSQATAAANHLMGQLCEVFCDDTARAAKPAGAAGH